MQNGPIDYNSPLGISKREWTRVLGVNLALLLLVYAIALICTLCGNGFFLLNFHSEDLQRIEDTLRGWNCFALIQICFATFEMLIVACYVAKAKPKWWYPLLFFALCVGIDLILYNVVGNVPGWIATAFFLTFAAIAPLPLCDWKPKEKWWIYLCRFAIGVAISFILNEGIAIFRTKIWELWQVNYSNSALFALTVEYDLALGLTLGFLTILIPWKRKGGSPQWETGPDALGCSPTSMNSSPKNSKIAKINVSPQFRKRLRLLRIKVYTIQTIAILVIAALPWFAGRPVEFALVYASFCLTRILLGFSHSLHFKSELACVTIGALCFWALTFLAPSAEVSIILSLCYGGGLALGFRLYWELHDLILYKKAAKTDRYAMLYVVFKANVTPKHINGVMRAKGYSDKTDIRMVQMYMQKDKVEYIAEVLNFAKITIEKRLTEIATDLYAKR